MVVLTYNQMIHSDLIEQWFKRSELAAFDRFIYLWISFNAWLAQNSRKETDREMIEWFKGNFGVYYEQLLENENSIKDDAEWFCKQGVLNPQKSRIIRPENIEDFKSLIDAIYQVRCNLLHGGNNPAYKIEREIVERATRLLVIIYQPLLEKRREFMASFGPWFTDPNY